MRIRTSIFLFWVVFVFVTPVWGVDTGLGSCSFDQPVEVTSREMEADGLLRKVRFVGDVVAKQGDVILYTSELILFFGKDQNEIERMEAPSALRMVQGARVATGDRGVFLAKEGKVVLTGSARVKNGENFLEGHEITVFLNEEKSWCKSREGGQVKAVFYPKKGKE